MSNQSINHNGIKKISFQLETLEKPIDQIVKNYLTSEHPRDVSPTSLLNWFSINTRSGGQSAFKNFLLDRKEYTDKLKEAVDQVKSGDPATAGTGLDGAIICTANDLVAQLEMVTNFRRLKVSHHFAKAKYNLVDFLGKGAKGDNEGDSILQEYTYRFLQDGMTYREA